MAEVADNARMTGREGRRDQVLELIRQSRVPLDDDEIAEAAQMNRIYVNMICRRLAENGLIVRTPGSRGKRLLELLPVRSMVRGQAGHRQARRSVTGQVAPTGGAAPAFTMENISGD